MANLKIGTFNVRGLRECYKRRKIFQFLYERQFDIICLQETHSQVSDERLWHTEWRGKVFFSHGETNSKGTAILIRKKAPITVGKVLRDREGRLVGCEIFHEESHFNVINVYAPNKDNPEFFLNVFVKIMEFEIETTSDKLIVGDMNLALNLDLDKTGGKYATNSKAAKMLKNYMKDEGLVDIYREMHPEDRASTWKRLNPEILLVRLDYMLLSVNLMVKCTHAEINAGYLSDHSIPWI